MKTIKQLSFIGLVITLVLTSCSMEKRVYMSGYHIDWKNGNRNSNKQELVKGNTGKQTEQNQIGTVEQSENETNTVDNSPTVIDDNITASADNTIISLKMNTPLLFQKKDKKKKEYQQVIEQIEECDVIILKNGQEIKAKIIEVGTNEIKYKKCDNAEGPSYTIRKSEVFMIKYPNGSKDIFSDNSTQNESIKQTTISDTEQKIEIISLLSFIFGVLGLLLFLILGWPFLMGTTATILGAIGLSKISKNKEKWSGKGFAIAGLMLGILDIIFFWIYVILIAALLL